MAQRRLLEEAVNTLVPRGKRSSVRKQVLDIAQRVVELLAVLVAKKPVLMPILQALQGLLAPADHETQPARLVIQRIRRLKKKLEKANDQDQVKIRRKLEALYELLVEDGEDDD